MTVRYVGGAIAAGLLTVGALTIAVERGYAQGGLPEKGPVTLVGCLQQGNKHDKFMLANPSTNAVASVPDPACTPAGGEQMIELEGVHKLHLDASIGRWVEISGKLEGSHHKPELRVHSFRQVPVVITKTVEVPVPAPEQPRAYNPPAAAAPEAPVATTGTLPAPEPAKKKMPKTASPLPLGLATTVMALMGALAFRLFRLRLEGRI